MLAINIARTIAHVTIINVMNKYTAIFFCILSPALSTVFLETNQPSKAEAVKVDPDIT